MPLRTITLAAVTAALFAAGCSEPAPESRDTGDPKTGAHEQQTNAAVATSGPKAEAQGDLVRYPARPVGQTVELRLDPDETAYRGSVSIELEITAPTRSFGFHAEEMSLARVELRGPQGETIGLDRRSAGDYGLIEATAAEILQPGRYHLAIDFERPYESRAVGLYRVERDGEGYLFTQFQAVDARKAFPCWDEPRYKIPFGMTIHAPSGDTVLFNTPVAAESTADGWTTREFEQTPPMSTYFLAIAAGPFDSIPIAGLDIPGRVYAPGEQAGLGRLGARMTPGILKALEQYFDRPYPYRKLDYVAVPDYWPGAMENAGLVTYRDRLLLVDEASASVAQRRWLAVVIAHELAHMWFGDLVTLSWWDDLWLNESFASWMAGKIVRDLYPQFRAELSDLRSTESAMVADARPSTKPIRKTVEGPAEIMEDLGLAYSKGQAVLEMAESWLGEETFRRGVLAYIDAHAWGNAEAADLWSALSEASGRDVQHMLAGFLEQSGVPLLTFERQGATGLSVSQERFLNAGVEAEARQWSIPVTIRYATAGGEEFTESFLLSEREREVTLGEGVQWYLPNAEASGYYRWTMPRAELLQLAASATERLTTRERIAFLGNARGLLQAGQIGGDDYLEMLARFGSDPDPDVAAAVMDGLGAVRAYFVPDARRDAFAGYVRHALEPALENFGLMPADAEPETVGLLRPRLIRTLAIDGSVPRVRDYATALAERFMQEPAAVDPSLAAAALAVAAWYGDRELYERYRRGAESAVTPVERGLYLGALAAFADPGLQREALDYAISDAVNNTETGTVVRGLPNTEAAAALRWRWLHDNYPTIAGRLPPDFRPSLVRFAGGCSEKRLAEARDFFMDETRRVDGTEAQLDKLADAVTDCARLREREDAAVADYLATAR